MDHHLFDFGKCGGGIGCIHNLTQGPWFSIGSAPHHDAIGSGLGEGDVCISMGCGDIASLPDGRYSFEDVLDNDGVRDETLTIALDMTVQGDRLTLDFSRTSPQCAGPVNISRATAVAACYVALKHVFPDVPANAGVLDAVDFVIPDGLVISAARPRPVGGYTETILRMIDVIFSATAQADPQRAVAHAYGTINALSIAGHRTDAKRKGQRWKIGRYCLGICNRMQATAVANSSPGRGHSDSRRGG